MNPSTGKDEAPKPTGAVSSKYGAVTTERGTFHPGEPVFIIRAQDATAIRNVANYLHDLQSIEDPKKARDPEMLKAIQDDISAFSKWAADNPNLVKLPD